MNVYISILIILVCAFFIVSTTTAYVQKDKAFTLSGFQTYRWVVTKSSENDPASRAIVETEKRIQDSVDKELNKWGWRETDQQPDVLVSYDVLVNRMKEHDQQTNASYTESFIRYYYNEYCGRWSPIDYPSQFAGYDVYEMQAADRAPGMPMDKATLAITLLEAQTDKKIWQGWTTEKLRDKKLTEKEIARSVNAIFRQS